MPATLLGNPIFKKYLAGLPEYKKSKAIARIQAAYSVSSIQEMNKDKFVVTEREWNVKFSPVRQYEVELQIGKFSYLGLSLYRAFPASCTCMDYQGRDDSLLIPCKHIWAAAFLKYGWDKPKARKKSKWTST